MPISTTITNFTKSHQKIELKHKQTNKNTHTHTHTHVWVMSPCLSTKTSLSHNKIGFHHAHTNCEVPLSFHWNLVTMHEKIGQGPLLYIPCHTHKNYITFYVKKTLAITSTHKFKSFTLRPWFPLNLHIVMSTNKQRPLQWKKKWGETLGSTNLVQIWVSYCVILLFLCASTLCLLIHSMVGQNKVFLYDFETID
jgi:hypothetical protein